MSSLGVFVRQLGSRQIGANEHRQLCDRMLQVRNNKKAGFIVEVDDDTLELLLALFTDEKQTAPSRRWVGAFLWEILGTFEPSDDGPLADFPEFSSALGDMLLKPVNEEIKLIAGSIIRTAYARNTPLTAFWRDDIAVRAVNTFRVDQDSQWVDKFDTFMEELSKNGKIKNGRSATFWVQAAAKDGERFDNSSGNAGCVLVELDNLQMHVVTFPLDDGPVFVDIPYASISKFGHHRVPLSTDTPNIQIYQIAISLESDGPTIIVNAEPTDPATVHLDFDDESMAKSFLEDVKKLHRKQKELSHALDFQTPNHFPPPPPSKSRIAIATTDISPDIERPRSAINSNSASGNKTKLRNNLLDESGKPIADSGGRTTRSSQKKEKSGGSRPANKATDKKKGKAPAFMVQAHLERKSNTKNTKQTTTKPTEDASSVLKKPKKAAPQTGSKAADKGFEDSEPQQSLQIYDIPDDSDDDESDATEEEDEYKPSKSSQGLKKSQASAAATSAKKEVPSKTSKKAPVKKTQSASQQGRSKDSSKTSRNRTAAKPDAHRPRTRAATAVETATTASSELSASDAALEDNNLEEDASVHTDTVDSVPQDSLAADMVDDTLVKKSAIIGFDVNGPRNQGTTPKQMRGASTFKAPLAKNDEVVQDDTVMLIDDENDTPEELSLDTRDYQPKPMLAAAQVEYPHVESEKRALNSFQHRLSNAAFQDSVIDEEIVIETGAGTEIQSVSITRSSKAFGNENEAKDLAEHDFDGALATQSQMGPTAHSIASAPVMQHRQLDTQPLNNSPVVGGDEFVAELSPSRLKYTKHMSGEIYNNATTRQSCSQLVNPLLSRGPPTETSMPARSMPGDDQAQTHVTSDKSQSVVDFETHHGIRSPNSQSVPQKRLVAEDPPSSPHPKRLRSSDDGRADGHEDQLSNFSENKMDSPTEDEQPTGSQMSNRVDSRGSPYPRGFSLPLEIPPENLRKRSHGSANANEQLSRANDDLPTTSVVDISTFMNPVAVQTSAPSAILGEAVKVLIQQASASNQAPKALQVTHMPMPQVTEVVKVTSRPRVSFRAPAETAEMVVNEPLTTMGPLGNMRPKAARSSIILPNTRNIQVTQVVEMVEPIKATTLPEPALEENESHTPSSPPIEGTRFAHFLGQLKPPVEANVIQNQARANDAADWNDADTTLVDKSPQQTHNIPRPSRRKVQINEDSQIYENNSDDETVSSGDTEEAESENDEDENTAYEEEMEWEAALLPHQRSFAEALERVSKRLLLHVVNTETALTSIVNDYETNAIRLITTMKEMHQEEHDKYMTKVEGVTKNVVTQLTEICSGLDGDRQEVRAVSMKIRNGKNTWNAAGQDVLKGIDALMQTCR